MEDLDGVAEFDGMLCMLDPGVIQYTPNHSTWDSLIGRQMHNVEHSQKVTAVKAVDIEQELDAPTLDQSPHENIQTFCPIQSSCHVPAMLAMSVMIYEYH